MPFFTTASYALPSKVVAVLGASPVAARPQVSGSDSGTVGLRTSDGGLGRVEGVRDGVRSCIGWLVGEMNGSRGGRGLEGMGVDDVLLRALGDIVRKNEMGGS